MTDYQAQLDDQEQADANEHAAAERAERTALAPGQRPAPLRVPILDTITDIEGDLLATADEIASSVQRPAFTVRAASPNDVVARSVALMGAKDAADPRRWRFNMAHRDAATAATWLAARLTGADGPFRPLTLTQHDRITATAAACRHRLDRALGEHVQRQETHLNVTCGCGGPLSVVTGAEDFTVRCRECGLLWTGTSLLDGLSAA
jgi:hypothetical protein